VLIDAGSHDLMVGTPKRKASRLDEQARTAWPHLERLTSATAAPSPT
jgi:hypothetical protein